MAIDQARSICLRQAWLAQPSTQHLLEDGRAWLQLQLSKHVGSYLVNYRPLFSDFESPVKYQICMAKAQERSAVSVQLIASDQGWPLMPNAVDVVILQHCLEFSAEPDSLLQQAVQCLRPGGHLLIQMVNPLSRSGLQHRWLTRGSQYRAWRLSSMYRHLQGLNMSPELQHWSGFGVCAQRLNCLKFARLQPHLVNRCNLFAGLYCVSARKLVRGDLGPVVQKTAFIQPTLPLVGAATRREKPNK
ncbi:hypothetical protein AKN87_01985 [Thiopseudomonas alkaliphila]|uniref:class I SAM-dependent methyltransferase n=1 Tax=Thiopseudomonas alkaliphila TaxID=1697053 RepID=UPI00069EA3F7|nr:methyltransferase domain-containing protein [Thiopseudomonas alkaliphila]AKX44011.1 hypothetical protein AKN87_01985 [Thiopseudomonas alkaliphila]AKX46247.1 hypothetical protein AKN94_01850 [Thiopseudomonas alkaliphila]AKX49317.1 hypothetical protein AKN93_07825 [Thiopseudomonas alkaliphila]AKX52774.1 hypothetical protein AKN91_03135 [Thiopseudomonas alkaliphila]AKX54299.1 hypothetical protein AKN90_00075 [Thiopseudomonas alkaliphila]